MTSISIDEFLSKLEKVKSNAEGHTALCPAHEDTDRSLSVKMSKEGKIILHCFAGCSFNSILDSLNIKPQQLFPPSTSISKAKLIAKYDYNDISGKLIYQACRYEPKKFIQRRPDPADNKKWIYNLKGVHPVPFRLPEVIDAVKTGKSIFIVEGEKDVLNLIKLGFVATCNSGGAGKWRKDFTQYFSSADLVLISDNDEPGRDHIEKIAEYLNDIASSISVANLDGLDKGQDVSDWISNGGTRDALIQASQDAPLWTPREKEKTEDTMDRIKSHPIDPERPPFKHLGHNDGNFFYMPDESLQLIRMNAEQHSQANLIALAPLIWWEDTFAYKKGVDWNAARNYMFRVSFQKGIYNSRKLRGCGTWYDNGRVVQHNGNMLISDGKAFNIEDFDTHFIYNASYPIEHYQAEPVSNTEASKFLEICRMPSWEKAISGTMLAGWCVVAPICGALTWRPHIWITGASGTGKTWITDNMIKPTLGHTAMNAQSNTTEAGIRQWLGINAFPVVLDETEGEDRRSRDRLQNILELMRQASSETGAPIVKGSSHGSAVEFKIRSCFSLSSVGVNIHQKADASRITILSLKRPHPADAIDLFDSLKAEIYHVNPEFCAGLRARAIKMIPTILTNSRTFGRAVAEKFGNQRIGDQFGVLIAGAYALISDKTISPEGAVKWIDAQDWTEQASIEDLSDEERCLNRILDYKLTYLVDRDRIEKTVSEILYESEISLSAENALARIGIRYKEEDDERYIIISDAHSGIQDILKNSEHEKNWGRILKRFVDAKTISCRFTGKVDKATVIPTSKIF